MMCSMFTLKYKLLHAGINGVWAKENLQEGVRYGPFDGVLKREASNPQMAWEVCVEI